MADVIDETVAMVRQKEAELIELKRAVNTFCAMKGLPARYGDSELRVSSGTGVTREDQFYGKQLATAVREYIQSQQHAVPAEEIVSALERGGFDFADLGWKKENRVRNLSISLAKNPKYFHRLPNGTFGLPEFYPSLPKKEKVEKDDEAEGTVETAGEMTKETSNTAAKTARMKNGNKTKPPRTAGAEGAESK